MTLDRPWWAHAPHGGWFVLLALWCASVWGVFSIYAIHTADRKGAVADSIVATYQHLGDSTVFVHITPRDTVSHPTHRLPDTTLTR